ncbi:hypothetical protein Hanom_Chr07g00660741 [Helianthus anomalus]
MVPDSISHLFFNCSFSQLVWNSLKPINKWGCITDEWQHIVSHLCACTHNNAIWSVVHRLVLGASVYYVWQERNRRIHENKTRSHEEISKLIQDAVKLRIMGLPLAKSAHTVQMANIWNLKGFKWLSPKLPRTPP